MVEFIQMRGRKNSEQNITEIAGDRSFVYLIMLIKLVLNKSNIVCIGVLSLLIVKKNSLDIFQW